MVLGFQCCAQWIGHSQSLVPDTSLELSNIFSDSESSFAVGNEGMMAKGRGSVSLVCFELASICDASITLGS